MKQIQEVFTALSKGQDFTVELSTVFEWVGNRRQYLTIENHVNNASVEICHHIDLNAYEVTGYEGNYYCPECDDWTERTLKTAFLLLENLKYEIVKF